MAASQYTGAFRTCQQCKFVNDPKAPKCAQCGQPFPVPQPPAAVVAFRVDPIELPANRMARIAYVGLWVTGVLYGGFAAMTWITNLMTIIADHNDKGQNFQPSNWVVMESFAQSMLLVFAAFGLAELVKATVLILGRDPDA